MKAILIIIVFTAGSPPAIDHIKFDNMRYCAAAMSSIMKDMDSVLDTTESKLFSTCVSSGEK